MNSRAGSSNGDDVRVVDATVVESGALDRLMRSTYSPLKCDFLRAHGGWMHRGNHNRFLVEKGGQLAGYSAVIPAPIFLRDRIISATWLIDVYIHKNFRGQKLQRNLDARVRQTADVILGVPNELAYVIHRKHGWRVRDDYRLLALPLRPTRMVALRELNGKKKLAIRLASYPITGLAAFFRWFALRRKIKAARVLSKPNPNDLAAVFENHRAGWITTNRDEDYIRWRFLESPHRSELDFYGADTPDGVLSLVAVTRTLLRNDVPVVRLLDIFGDLTDKALLSDLLKLISQHAISRGAIQITSVATNQLMKSALRAHGFVFDVPFRFCWIGDDERLMGIVGDGPCHWTYADSDSDTPA